MPNNQLDEPVIFEASIVKQEQPDSMNASAPDRNSFLFRVPDELKNDILYCQKSLREYIHMHQVLSSKFDRDDSRIVEIEREMIDIGIDQKRVIESLRLCIEKYFIQLEQLNINIDRHKININISRQLTVHPNESYEPTKVKRRLDEDDLFDKYVFQRNTTEQMEVEISPQDILSFPPTTTYQPIKSQISLLKPKSERFSGNIESTSNQIHQKQHILQKYNNTIVPGNSGQNASSKASNTPAVSVTSNGSNANTSNNTNTAINNSRLNLLQALKKAKDEQKSKQVATTSSSAPSSSAPISSTGHKLIHKNPSLLKPDKRKVSPSPPKSDPTPPPPSSSSSSSSSTSSTGSFEFPDLPDEEVEPPVLGKEAFLRLVGLCTLTFKDYLMSRRSERRRRNVTSTERLDFHYGKFELFERQASRSSKRPTLLSTSTVRAPKRTVQAVENAEEKPAKRNQSSSRSSSNDESRTCHVCFKNFNEPIYDCLSCNKQFHKGCNKGPQKFKDKYCPFCGRQQPRRRTRFVHKNAEKNENCKL